MIKITFEKKRKSGAGAAKAKKGIYKPIIICLAIFFAINLLVLVLRVKNSHYSYTFEYSSMSRAVASHDFPDLVYQVAHNIADNEVTQKDTSEFEVLARYYEKTFLYHAYQEIGDNEKAETLYNELEEMEALMTEPDVADGVEYLKANY